MNIINRIGENAKGESCYTLTTEDGLTFDCTLFYEKKTGKTHIKLPKDNPTGRTFIREDKLANTDTFEFETKTEFRTGIGSGGWRSKLHPEEVKEVQELEDRLAAIKAEASKRVTPKIDPDSIEGIERDIAKLKAKLEAKKAKVGM